MMFATHETSISSFLMSLLWPLDCLRINQDALGRMPFRVISNATTGIDVWRKDLAGGDVAVAIVNMGAANHGRPGRSKPADWKKVAGKVYSDVACPNLNHGDSSKCLQTKGAAAVSCCEEVCWADSRCDAINVDTTNGHCVKRACPAANIGDPDLPAPMVGFDSYHLPAAAPGAGLAAGFRLALADVGFMFNTRVSVRDVFSGVELGISVGSFETTETIALHGTQLLRLTYAPSYPPHRTSEL